jgi:hypothetical protein
VAAGVGCDSLTSTTTPVCDLTTVASGTCTSGTTSCGGLNQACCTSSYYSSFTSYDFCAGSGTRCLSSVSATTGLTQYLCTACGDKGQRCCVDSTTSTTGSTPGCKSPYVCSQTYTTSGYSYTCTDATGTATSTSTSTGL